MTDIIYVESSGFYYFECPHCDMLCEVHKNDINCTIFRHAINKKDSSFVDPHASEEQCKNWLKDGLVYGCTKPFIFDGNIVKKCMYI